MNHLRLIDILDSNLELFSQFDHVYLFGSALKCFRAQRRQ